MANLERREADGDRILKAEDFEGLIKTKDLAQLLGVTERRIQSMTQAGYLHKADVEAGKRNVYKMPEVVREYRTTLAAAAQGHDKKDDKSSADLEKQKIKAEIKYKEAKAKKADVELKEYEGLFHRAEDVEKLVNELIFSIRASLMAMPGRLASECAGKSSVEISDIIKKEVYQTLEQLAEHEYDPARYKELVRQREGYRIKSQEEEEDEEDEF